MALPGTTLRAGVHHKTTVGRPDGIVGDSATIATDALLPTAIRTGGIDRQGAALGTPNEGNQITARRPGWRSIITPLVGQTYCTTRLDISQVELRRAIAV